LGPLRFFTKIRGDIHNFVIPAGDIHNFVFIAGVVDTSNCKPLVVATGNKLIAVVVDTDD
jgi:hypothetical protein